MTHARGARASVRLAGLLAMTLLAVPAAHAGTVDFSIVQLSPGTQMQPIINGSAPYFYFLLTNQGSGPDQYLLEVRNVVVNPTPNWFPQVCVGTLCFPDSTTVTIGAAEAESVGVQVVPFSDGVGTFDFHVHSLTDPGLSADYVGLTLYAGTFAVGVEETAGRAQGGFVLGQNYPNPAPAGTRISFALPDAAPVTLAVFDVAGRLLDTIAEGTLPAGAHAVTWDGMDGSGRPLPAGVYYYRLSTPAGALTKKMTLIR